jgi:hypothetical protein
MRKFVWLLCALPAVAVSQVAAQDVESKISWDIPSFFSPRPMDDIGLYYTSSERASRGNANGLAAIWRQSGNLNLGVRAGFFDFDDVGGSLLVGAELYGPLNSLFGNSTQFDAAWTLGAGALFGHDFTVGSIPLGMSLGLNLGTGGFRFEPYVHPRAAFDIIAVGEGDNEETDTDIAFVLDLGADVNLGDRFILRLGGSLIDREAFGVGLVLRWPRPISVVR